MNKLDIYKFGEKVEDYIIRMFHATKSANKAWDCETNNKLVEIKGCQAIIKKATKPNYPPGAQFGRYHTSSTPTTTPY